MLLLGSCGGVLVLKIEIYWYQQCAGRWRGWVWRWGPSQAPPWSPAAIWWLILLPLPLLPPPFPFRAALLNKGLCFCFFFTLVFVLLLSVVICILSSCLAICFEIKRELVLPNVGLMTLCEFVIICVVVYIISPHVCGSIWLLCFVLLYFLAVNEILKWF